MTLPFGVSVGDFIAAIALINAIINALEDTAGSSKEYQSLIKELESLRIALDQVRDIDAHNVEQKAALKTVTDQCADTIVDFLNHIKKYQPSLKQGGSSQKWKDSLRKVQWSLYSKEDVRKFQAQVQGHTASIQIVLSRIHMSSTAKTSDETTTTLIRLEKKLDQQRLAQTITYQALMRCWIEFRAVLLAVVYYNLQAFELLVNPIRIYQQVGFGRPVILVDAHDRRLPFHLELIGCWEAFELMLKFHFRTVPGLCRIDAGQYALQDARCASEITRRQPFQSCFRPGRVVNMSIIFEQGHDVQEHCPGCRAPHKRVVNKDLNCLQCGLWFRIIEVINEDGTHKSLSCVIPHPIPPEGANTASDRISDFMRVRIRRHSHQVDKKVIPGRTCWMCSAGGAVVWVIPGKGCPVCGNTANGSLYEGGRQTRSASEPSLFASNNRFSQRTQPDTYASDPPVFLPQIDWAKEKSC